MAAIGLFSGAQADAATYYWANTSGSAATSWGTSINWTTASDGLSGNAFPGSADTITFSASSVTNDVALALNADRQVEGIVFNSPFTTTIQSHVSSPTNFSFTVGAGGITATSGAGAVSTVSNGTTGFISWKLNGSQTWANDFSSSLTISGGVSNSSATAPVTLTLGGSGTGGVTVSSPVSDNSSGTVAIAVNTTGGGIVTLNGANTYTGGTAVTAGVLKIGNATALGGSAGAVTVSSGGALDLNATVMTGTNPLTLNGTGVGSGGALTNSGATSATYAGLLSLGSSSTILATTGGITLSNTGAITGSGADLTVGGAKNTVISGIIGTGAGGITKQDSGTLTLSGVNTYTGVTTINGGQVTVNKATSLGTVAGNTVVNSGGEVFLNASSITVAEPFNIAGTGVTGALHVGGNATGIILSGPITLSSSAKIQMDGGTAATISGGINLGSNTLTVGGAGTLTVSTVGITGTGGSVTKVTSGTTNFNARNDYSGLTTISAGTLAFGSGGSIAGNLNLGTSTSRGTFQCTARSLYNFTTAQTITGDGTLNIGGTKVITIGGNLNPGNNAGTITVTGYLTLAPASVTNITGAITTMELAGNGGVSGTDYDKVAVSGQLSLGGTLNIVSSGSYTLNQAGTYPLFSFGTQIGNFDFVTVGGVSLLNSGGTWTGASSGYNYTFGTVGNTLVLTVAAGTSLSGVQTWRQTNFGDSANSGNGADGADPDNDGLSNLIEYATGTNPNTANAAVVTVGSSAGFLTLTYTRIADTTLTYTVEGSSDLTTWATVSTGNNPSAGVANVAGQVTVTDTTALTSRRFLRLKVSY